MQNDKENSNGEFEIHDVYPFDTEFDIPKKAPEKPIKRKRKLKPLTFRNKNSENKLYLPFIFIIMCISIANLIYFNISKTLIGLLEVIFIYLIATQLEFKYDDKCNYYMYNILTLVQAFLKNTIWGNNLINNAELILNISIGGYIFQEVLTFVNIFPTITSFLYLTCIYGLIIGFILCFINQNIEHIEKVGKIFYFIEIVMFIKEGFINILIYNIPVLNNFRVINLVVILTLILLIKQCEIYDFRQNREN